MSDTYIFLQQYIRAEHVPSPLHARQTRALRQRFASSPSVPPCYTTCALSLARMLTFSKGFIDDKKLRPVMCRGAMMPVPRAHRQRFALSVPVPPGPRRRGRALPLARVLLLQERHQRSDGLLPALGRGRQRLGLALGLRVCVEALHKRQVLRICSTCCSCHTNPGDHPINYLAPRVTLWLRVGIKAIHRR